MTSWLKWAARTGVKVAARTGVMAASVIAAGGAAGQAAEPAAASLATRSLAGTCAPCHGTAGRAAPGATVPGLAGAPAGYLVEQMKAYKSGARPATIMQQLAKGYSDAQIERLGAYFAAQAASAP